MARDTVVSKPRRLWRGRRALNIALLALLLVAAALLSMFAGAYVAVSRTLPSLELAAQIASPQTTKIYDSSPTPVLLAELRGLDTRDVLADEDIPQVARDAIVAIEDPRFYAHKGVDFIAILRAGWADLRHRQVDQSGSTITQQLIKNAFLTDDQATWDAAREPALAYEVENRWTKERILNEYLNVVYFGSGAYGIQAAARSYFGVDAKDISLDQAALLAGLPKAPSAYSPRQDAAAALARRNQVLNKMYQQRYIDSTQLQEALAAPVKLVDAGSDNGIQEPYWVESVREQLVARYGSSTVMGGGLRVYTSLDLKVQQAAEAAIRGVLGPSGGPSAALVAINVRTGALVAMVGGSDFSAHPLNLATQGHWMTGSAFAPFALIAALEQGISPDSAYDSGPTTIALPTGALPVASIDNGTVTLARGVADSSDGVFARLTNEVGADAVAKIAGDMGVTSPLGAPVSPALTLTGPPEGASPLEMATAYATLAAGGQRLSARVAFDPSKTGLPVSIQKVTDGQQQLLDDNGATSTRVIDQGLAELATSCLQGVISDGAGRAATIGRPAAGMTGTSADGRNAWFVGYTPELAVAVWVGYQGQQTVAGDTALTSGGAGSDASVAPAIPLSGSAQPAEIWARFMTAALAGTPVSSFSTAALAQWVTVPVCSESRLLPTDLCPTVVNRLFRFNEAPTDSCDIHVPQAVFMPNVVGTSLTKAKKTLANAGLKVKTVTDAGSLQPAGTVTKQDHTAGNPIVRGTEVLLHVSAGLVTAVPKLVGFTLDQAQAQIGRANLVADVTQQTADAPAGTVLSQDPAAGTVLTKGATVHLVVSSGPATTSST
jgi:penicillin-binding protein 1A